MNNQQIKGFTVNPHPKNNRLMVATLSKKTINNFCKNVIQIKKNHSFIY